MNKKFKTSIEFLKHQTISIRSMFTNEVET
jgi:hypothetical protein